MEKQEQKFELIISTESKVLACNIADFEKKLTNFYLLSRSPLKRTKISGAQSKK